MGKQPSPAAWRRLLAAYEDGFNALLREDLEPEERAAAYLVHDLLRLRASGAEDRCKTTDIALNH